MNENRGVLRIGILGVAVFILSIVVVVNFGAQLEKINWRLVSIICIVAAVFFVLYRWNEAPKSKNTYDVQDLVMSNGAADLWKHLILFFAGLSAWVIIQKVLTSPKEDITALLTIVLGVFVSKEILGAFAEAMKSRPAATAGPSQDIHITAAAEQPKDAAPGAAQPLPPPGAADLLAAGRGIEPLSPKIGPEDVGKAVALVSKTKPRKRRN